MLLSLLPLVAQLFLSQLSVDTLSIMLPLLFTMQFMPPLFTMQFTLPP